MMRMPKELVPVIEDTQDKTGMKALTSRAPAQGCPHETSRSAEEGNIVGLVAEP